MSYAYAQSIDDFIMLLAVRYDANPNYVEETDDEAGDGSTVDANTLAARMSYIANQHRGWALVSEGVRLHLSHPLTADERAHLKYIEVEMFTAEMCRNRAQYALWRRTQQLEREQKTKSRALATNSTGVSGFSITKHSIQDEVARLYAQVRSSLPSCDDVELSDEDDEDTTAANPFDKLKQFNLKSQADVNRDMALAKAEEDLLAQFAALQQEHFKKTRKWVDVPSDILAMKRPAAAIEEQRAIPRSSSKPLSAAEINLQSFEKTVGVIRNNSGVGGSSGTSPSGVSKSSANNASGSSRNTAIGISSTNPIGHRVVDPAITDPIKLAKMALNPYARPARPSAGYEEDEDDEDEDGESFLTDNVNDLKDMLNDWKKPSSGGGEGTVRGASNSTAVTARPQPVPHALAGNTTSRPAQPASASSAGRGGRWNIVEYEDDDDDVE